MNRSIRVDRWSALYACALQRLPVIVTAMLDRGLWLDTRRCKSIGLSAGAKCATVLLGHIRARVDGMQDM